MAQESPHVVNLPGIRAESWIQSQPAHQISGEGRTPEELVELDKFYRIRLICRDLNNLFVRMEEECSSLTCAEMKAGEWLYLCAAHEEPKHCSAIDYIVHTLEGAQTLLNSPTFYSHNNGDHSTEASAKMIQNVARRLARIFSHCWFHHQQIFIEFEAETQLYATFLELTTKNYKMIAPKMLPIPFE